MEYFNIKNDLSLVLSEDVKYTHKQLVENLKLEMSKSDINLTQLIKISNSQLDAIIDIDGKKYSFITLLKNITGAGWKDKPKIKRVQVSNITDDCYVKDSNAVFNLIIGYYNYDNNPIIVCWDAYRYLNHKTLRSCYVSVDSLKLGYLKGYYDGVDSSQKIWIFKGEYFKKFLESYIEYSLSVKR